MNFIKRSVKLLRINDSFMIQSQSFHSQNESVLYFQVLKKTLNNEQVIENLFMRVYIFAE